MASKRDGLAQRRSLLGFTQETFAEALGVERTTVTRWETGLTVPHIRLRPTMARLLQLPAEALAALLEAGPLRRQASSAGMSAGLAEAVDLVDVAALSETVHGLGERYDRVPSASLLAEAGQCLGQIGFIQQRVQRPRVRRELVAAEAAAATLMGQLVWDASQRRDHGSARTYFDQAIAAAQRLGDPVAEGHALLRQSFVALYGVKDPKLGLSLAGQAASVAEGSSRVLSGLALLHSAEARAMLGQAGACEQELRVAAGRLELIDSHDAAAELFSEHQFDRLAGSCYLFLGKHQQAQVILERVARSLQDRQKSRAIVLGNLTLAYLRQANLDAATATLTTAIEEVEQTRGGGGLNVIFTAAGELRPWRNQPGVLDLYDRLHALMIPS
ncbi:MULTISPECIES: helix-turn-helix domain-containing protein [unclassified Crossiella]|uniref:helix-turn-helix transcriptional regulator n=1 Tax=unclassified Crossiella TaxID=2620835 RepID=UPI001FFF5918|nr:MULTISPECIES: helix-turn-helix domain-containing protein [unclassified Crossiella]MCK2245458.1 helix-turn-helix domain-containing protein [Crossiella sp. S99.2]MCK2259110.1 helix-turn-helix domain-containing protein [Crossiella sp. S99.1]